MLLPFAAHHGRFEKAFSPQPRSIEQCFCPLAQFATQPMTDRYSAALLGSLDQFARHMAVQDLSQRPLGLTVAHLHRLRQPPRKLNDAMIEEWNAGFER